MAETSKLLSYRDSAQTLQGAFNDVDKSLTTNGFLVGKVGHKISAATTTTNVTDDTVVYTFTDTGVVLYQLTVIFTDATQATLMSAERTA